MPANKRTRLQRLHDLSETAARYLKGERQADIAASLGVSDKQISYDVQRIKEQWRQNAIRDIGTHQAEELAKLDMLEAELWQAWQNSLQPLEHTQVDDDDADVEVRAGHAGQGRVPAHRSRKRTSTRTEGQHGNVAFLNAIERVIAARCRILGLLAPTTVTVDGHLTFGDLYALATGQQERERPELRLLPADPPGDEDGSGDDADVL